MIFALQLARHGVSVAFGDERLPSRFWSKVALSVDGCWLWTAAVKNTGYGAFKRTSGPTVNAHRHSYRTLVGEVPDGLVLDHLCRNRTCVNPAHLEAVTLGENTRRGDSSAATVARHLAQTHCWRGHAFDAQNTAITPDGVRRCRQCSAINARNHRDKLRASGLCINAASHGAATNGLLCASCREKHN